MPKQIPDELKKEIRKSLAEAVSLVGKYLEMDITREARELYEGWYKILPQSVHSKRIDTMAMRLLPLLAINDRKDCIDREVVEKATAIAGWQLEVRMELDPY